MANFIGLKLARDSVSGDRIQHEGVQDRWAVYVSEERHVSVDKAVDAVGLGERPYVPYRQTLNSGYAWMRLRLQSPRITNARYGQCAS